MAEMFEDGRIGGKTITQRQVFDDTPRGRAGLVRFYRDHDVVEVYRVRSPRLPKQRVPARELLAIEFVVTGKIR